MKIKSSVRSKLSSHAQTLGMLPVLLLLCLGLAIANDRFLSIGNLSIVLQQASVNTVLAAGMTFVILTGGIDLSVGAIVALSAMVSLITSLNPEMAMFAIPLGLLAGILVGTINGFLVARLGLPSFIVTLASLTAVRGLARLIGNDQTIFNADLPFAVIGNGSLFGISYLVIIAFLVILISWFVLRRTVYGLHIYAVGGNPKAAHVSGLKLTWLTFSVFLVSGFLAALGGIMAAARLFAANGLQMGQGYELDAIAAVILGGISFKGGLGSIWGALVGALIIAVLSNGLILAGVSEIWQYIVKGAVIVLAVGIDKYRLKLSQA
ncbi:ribose ABC transporter permease [Rhizobium sp. Root1204]|uniref:ABC transporter permease subunit n=1 Tax=Rhizobium sp. Root1204 TaxID=1736428 RepID=UPI0007150E7E|nr:ribose ABC transporter permease [Rhizobium sp. Root1204]KQV41352.1 ribose ABC transporter permease [Rhizobium sp. Root1204]